MARARYQVLVIPYCITDGQVRFCAFRRTDLDIWQFIAGGGEDKDASIIESARREAFEEAGIPVTCSYSPLDTCCSIPADCFRDAEALWAKTALSSPNTHSQSRSKIRLCSCPASTPSTNGQRMRAPMQCCNTTATGPPCGN